MISDNENAWLVAALPGGKQGASSWSCVTFRPHPRHRCGLGCTLPFDYIDGAVPRPSLGWPRSFELGCHSRCHVQQVLPCDRYACIVMGFLISRMSPRILGVNPFLSQLLCVVGVCVRALWLIWIYLVEFVKPHRQLWKFIFLLKLLLDLGLHLTLFWKFKNGNSKVQNNPKKWWVQAMMCCTNL
jgi:hypothetical protein